MLTIIHGENLIRSREKLFQLKQTAKNKKQQLNTLLAKKLDPKQLETALLAKDLFGQEQCLIIEELHSLPNSKKRTNYIKSIQSANQFIDIILWEKKSLSKTVLKNFPQAQVFVYPMGKTLWKLLDQLNPNPKNKKQQLELLQQAVAEDSAEFCLTMISKRISDLVAVTVGARLKMHPFVESKLKEQKQKFALTQLLNCHQKIYELDKRLKHSQNLLSLSGELDLLLISL